MLQRNRTLILLPLLLCLVIIPTCILAKRLESQLQKIQQPLDSKSVETHILQTALNSSKHEKYIYQMAELGAFRRAYLLYKKRNEAEPLSAYANLWQGVAGIAYWEEEFIYESGRLPIEQTNEILKDARTCFETAFRLDSKSSVVKRKYGLFVWENDHQMARGLAMIREASVQDPKDAEAHYFLGEIYFNPSGNAYSLKKAEQEFKQSIRLAPDNLGPYWFLAIIYTDQKRNQEARKMLATCIGLFPHEYWQTLRGKLTIKKIDSMNATLSSK